MSVIFVYGVQEEYPPEKLERFWKEIRRAIHDNPNLNLVPDEVSVFFPRDMLQKGLGEKIVIWGEGFLNYAFRTKEVLDEYAETVGKIAKKFFPGASSIKCFINSFRKFEINSFRDLQQGFWQST